MIAILGWVETQAQTLSFEKQALTSVQQMPASKLDPELPERPFQTWFNELIGPRAGVVWQLAECGEQVSAPGGTEQDLPACVEINAGLPDGRKLIVSVAVGTFKRGLTGAPSFFRAVVERNEQLQLVHRLYEVPQALRVTASGWSLAPLKPLSAEIKRPKTVTRRSERSPIKLPSLIANKAEIKKSPIDGKRPLIPSIDMPSLIANVADVNPSSEATGSIESNSEGIPVSLNQEEVPPPPPNPARGMPQEPPTVAEGVLQGKATVKVKPDYPQSARKMNALGRVEVRILISEKGTVIDAKAVSGHLALRSAAVKAASQWIFKPTTVGGTPIKVRGILTFIFAASTQ